DTLFSSGDPPEFFYFMRAGCVQMVREGAPAWMLHGRQVFGMNDALLDRSRTHAAVACAALQLMKVRIEDWLELLDDSFELARASVAGLARSVAGYEEKVWLSAGASAPAARVRATNVRPRRLTVVERLALLMDAP